MICLVKSAEEEKDLLHLTPASELLKASSSIVLIDFHGQLTSLAQDALAYRDLSIGGHTTEAAANLYDALRWADSIQVAERIFIVDVLHSSTEHEHSAAVHEHWYVVFDVHLLSLAASCESLVRHFFS